MIPGSPGSALVPKSTVVDRTGEAVGRRSSSDNPNSARSIIHQRQRRTQDAGVEDERDVPAEMLQLPPFNVLLDAPEVLLDLITLEIQVPRAGEFNIRLVFTVPGLHFRTRKASIWSTWTSGSPRGWMRGRSRAGIEIQRSRSATCKHIGEGSRAPNRGRYSGTKAKRKGLCPSNMWTSRTTGHGTKPTGKEKGRTHLYVLLLPAYGCSRSSQSLPVHSAPARFSCHAVSRPRRVRVLHVRCDSRLRIHVHARNLEDVGSLIQGRCEI